MTEITEAEFFERFKPLEGEDEMSAPVSNLPDGIDVRYVWTCCDAENDQIVISGMHRANAWGYYIATVPVPAGEEYYYMNLRPTAEAYTGYNVDDEDDLRLAMVFDQAWKSDDDDGARQVLEYYTSSDDAAKEIIDMVMIKLCGWSVPTLVEMAGKLPQDA